MPRLNDGPDHVTAHRTAHMCRARHTDRRFCALDGSGRPSLCARAQQRVRLNCKAPIGPHAKSIEEVPLARYSLREWLPRLKGDPDPTTRF
jgi:hypothetical protein